MVLSGVDSCGVFRGPSEEPGGPLGPGKTRPGNLKMLTVSTTAVDTLVCVVSGAVQREACELGAGTSCTIGLDFKGSSNAMVFLMFSSIFQRVLR